MAEDRHRGEKQGQGTGGAAAGAPVHSHLSHGTVIAYFSGS